jgi:hypothetical protein
VTIVDPLGAVLDYLKADEEVAALVSARIYGHELPGKIAQGDPRYAIVGWYTAGDADAVVALQRPRIDVACYGPTALTATTLYWTVVECLKYRERGSTSDVLIHTIVQEGGPVQNRAPDNHWPFVWSSWRVTAGEESTA